MKKASMLIIMLLLGLGTACASAEWYVVEEESAHDFVEDLRAFVPASPRYGSAEQAKDAMQYYAGSETLSVNRSTLEMSASLAPKEMESYKAKKDKDNPGLHKGWEENKDKDKDKDKDKEKHGK